MTLLKSNNRITGKRETRDSERERESRRTFDGQNTDLSKVAAVAEDHKLLDAVVRHHGQLSLLDDVHLPADVPLLTDVVPGAVHLGLQLQHQLHQQPGLAVRKDLHLVGGAEAGVEERRGEMGGRMEYRLMHSV